MPKAEGQNHSARFLLARGIIDLEQELGRKRVPAEEKELFQSWYQQAKPLQRPDQSCDEYYFEFLDARANAKCGLDSGLLARALDRALTGPLPAEALQFQRAELQHLVALCAELQRLQGDMPFYLSSRTVAALMGGRISHTQAASWLRGLVRTGILTLVRQGGPETNRASRYRYGATQSRAAVTQTAGDEVEVEP